MCSKRAAIAAVAFLCAVLAGGDVASALSPLVSNASFAGGSFTSWSDTTTTGCSSAVTLFAGVNASDQDSDSGLSRASSGTSCVDASTATLGLTQTFSISGTPTAQTYSFWYNGTLASAGDNTCGTDTGTATGLTLTLNGSAVASVSNPTLDGAWHQVSGGTSALQSGSNTIAIKVALGAASGSVFSVGLQRCVNSKAAQTFAIDDITLGAGSSTTQPWFGSWRASFHSSRRNTL